MNAGRKDRPGIRKQKTTSVIVLGFILGVVVFRVFGFGIGIVLIRVVPVFY
jgi:hypothetical protein